MGTAVQALILAAASVATFTGVYLITPSGRSEAPAAPGAAKPAARAAKGNDVANPLEPAKRGMIECHHPNETRKTCRSMSTYEALGGGRYMDTTVALVANEGPTLLEIHLPVTIKSGSVCAMARPRDYAKGKLIVGGRALHPKDSARILEAAARRAKGIMNKEICTAYASSFGDLTGKAYIDGVAQPTLNYRMKWVRAGDGYSVAP